MATVLKAAFRREPFRTMRGSAFGGALFLTTVAPADWVRRPRMVRQFLAVKPYTLLSYRRMRALYELKEQLDGAGVPGALVQCGVWNGGSAGILAVAGRPERIERRLWLFDSWQGQPVPRAIDRSGDCSRVEAGLFRGSVERVQELLFSKLRVPPERVFLRRGWFSETVPEARNHIGPIALLHVDCDFYEPVRFCLEELTPLVVPGGYVVVDDYGAWEGARQATDEFRAQHGVAAPLVWIDDSGVYYRREDGTRAA